MDYKNKKSNKQLKYINNAEHYSENDLPIPIELIEDLFDFESEVFIKLIEAFTIFCDSGDFLRCQIILLKEVIPFFQTRSKEFKQNSSSITYFIDVFEGTRIFYRFFIIIQEKNEILLKPTILLISLLSSLNDAFLQYISTIPDLLVSIFYNILAFNDKQLFENIIILFNNSLKFLREKFDIQFLNLLFQKIQTNQLDTNIILNLFINLIRFSELQLINFPFIIEKIHQGISESFFIDSMNLIYYSYQSELNRNFLFPHLASIIVELEAKSSLFSNQQSFILYFRILLDILKCNENELISLILRNFQIEALKNSQKMNDSLIFQYMLEFLSKSPPEFIMKYANECFNNTIFCLHFLVDCINDSDFNLKRSSMKFLPIFLKATKPEFLNFLIDGNFIYTLMNFIESDEPQNQKIALQFLNSIIDSNLYFQSYSKQLFEKFMEEEVMQSLNDLKTFSDDSEIAALAENVISFVVYVMSDTTNEE